MTSWYSDAALAKQAALAAMPEGETPPVDELLGVLEPRVPPSDAERCNCCGLDARDHVGGEEHGGRRWCSVCVDRGHYEDDS